MLVKKFQNLQDLVKSYFCSGHHSKDITAFGTKDGFTGGGQGECIIKQD